ncbi:MAG: hypothetical protein JRF72_21880 [Deltaproteobacteria bacterium]|jgi:hypothetical protein|nr:hypothetical protein [Deltaproteobacteria bacterium]
MNYFTQQNTGWKIAFCALLCVVLIHMDIPAAAAEQTKEEKARQRMLDREAANALWRLKKALKEDGFYSGRVRLNVWRVAAIEAGKFDPDTYEAFKKQLYEKSVHDSLKCFEYFLEQNSRHDANMCLQTWKMHAQEIGIFDEPTYQALVKRLNDMSEP